MSSLIHELVHMIWQWLEEVLLNLEHPPTLHTTIAMRALVTIPAAYAALDGPMKLDEST
jgi:hypothetical protein